MSAALQGEREALSQSLQKIDLAGLEQRVELYKAQMAAARNGAASPQASTGDMKPYIQAEQRWGDATRALETNGNEARAIARRIADIDVLLSADSRVDALQNELAAQHGQLSALQDTAGLIEVALQKLTDKATTCRAVIDAHAAASADALMAELGLPGDSDTVTPTPGAVTNAIQELATIKVAIAKTTQRLGDCHADISHLEITMRDTQKSLVSALCDQATNTHAAALAVYLPVLKRLHALERQTHGTTLTRIDVGALAAELII